MSHSYLLSDRLSRRERFKKNMEDWKQYGPAIMDLMERIEALERRRAARRGG